MKRLAWQLAVSHAKLVCYFTEEADNILASTNITEEEYERFEAVMAKFEELQGPPKLYRPYSIRTLSALKAIQCSVFTMVIHSLDAILSS